MTARDSEISANLGGGIVDRGGGGLRVPTPRSRTTPAPGCEASGRAA